MINWLVLRPLFTGLVELALAFKVFKDGKLLRITISFFLIFLAGYQIGEFFFFFFDGNRFWLAFSLFSTTMLPPFGLAIIEKLSGKKEPTVFFFICSTLIGLIFLIFPQTVPQAQECNCFVKFDSSTLTGNARTYFSIWGWYYILSLFTAMVLTFIHIVKNEGDKHKLKLTLVAYVSFFPISYVLMKVLNTNLKMWASVMCSLAIFSAFIFANMSLGKKGFLKIKD